MAQFLLELIYSLGNCLHCFPGSPTLKINGRIFKILRLLGEGGFSYVYLVEERVTHQLFALKKIRCPFGAESVQQAMGEVEAYRLFAHVPTIISAVDHVVVTERGAADEASKTVYVLLPYYRHGNLQDMINANFVNRAAFPERHLMMLFLGVCHALRAMHRYRPGPAERMDMGHEEEIDHDGTRASAASTPGHRQPGNEPDEEPEQGRPFLGTGSDRLDAAAVSAGSQRSFAHHDIKPSNIMIDDSGSAPIVMDLGSVAPSPVAITSQSMALQLQDTAAEHSTMPYRAPELFDVRTGSVVDTKSDIWSLGCTLFACLVGKSPFEMRSDETGGSLSLCVLGGDWRFPDESPAGAQRGKTIGHAKARAAAASASHDSAPAESCSPISEPIRHIVRRCLRVDPAERPDIDKLIVMVERVVEALPDDDAPSSSP